jgi:hypothetical protein
MSLCWQTGVSVESWVDMTTDVVTRCEVDHLNDSAILYFGEAGSFVLHLSRENLRHIAVLATRAHEELQGR